MSKYISCMITVIVHHRNYPYIGCFRQAIKYLYLWTDNFVTNHFLSSCSVVDAEAVVILSKTIYIIVFYS